VISVPAGGVMHDVTTDTGGGLTAPRLMQFVPNTDFGVEVKFDSTVSVYEVIQGLIIEQDSNDYIRFDFYYDGTATHIYSGSFTNGALGTLSTEGRKNTVISSGVLTAPLYMRVKRVGNTWTLSYSTNGTTWTQHHQFTRSMTVKAVGPFGANPQPAATPPTFSPKVDYFRSIGTGI